MIISWLFLSCLCCFKAGSLDLNQFLIIRSAEKMKLHLFSGLAVLEVDTECYGGGGERRAGAGTSCGGLGLPGTGSDWICVGCKRGWVSTAAWRIRELQFLPRFIRVVVGNNLRRGCSAVKLPFLSPSRSVLRCELCQLGFAPAEVMELLMAGEAVGAV